MKQTDLFEQLEHLDTKGIFVYSTKDLKLMFPDDSESTLKIALKRHTKNGYILRACRGVYVNTKAISFDGYILEHVAKTLRRGEFNYVSLESMLSEYGVISQMPLNYLTIMTTGRKQLYKTYYGSIEFTHTSKNVMEILNNTSIIPGRPLKVATKNLAIKDLRRVNRNLHLLDPEEI